MNLTNLMNFINFLFLLVPRLTQQHEHIVLVGLHARLVESVHPEDTTGDAASQFVEIE